MSASRRVRETMESARNGWSSGVSRETLSERDTVARGSGERNSKMVNRTSSGRF